jgi:hypothetical protein
MKMNRISISSSTIDSENVISFHNANDEYKIIQQIQIHNSVKPEDEIYTILESYDGKEKKNLRTARVEISSYLRALFDTLSYEEGMFFIKEMRKSQRLINGKLKNISTIKEHILKAHKVVESQKRSIAIIPNHTTKMGKIADQSKGLPVNGKQFNLEKLKPLKETLKTTGGELLFEAMTGEELSYFLEIASLCHKAMEKKGTQKGFSFEVVEKGKSASISIDRDLFLETIGVSKTQTSVINKIETALAHLGKREYCYLNENEEFERGTGLYIFRDNKKEITGSQKVVWTFSGITLPIFYHSGKGLFIDMQPIHKLLQSNVRQDRKSNLVADYYRILRGCDNTHKTMREQDCKLFHFSTLRKDRKIEYIEELIKMCESNNIKLSFTKKGKNEYAFITAIKKQSQK